MADFANACVASDYDHACFPRKAIGVNGDEAGLYAALFGGAYIPFGGQNAHRVNRGGAHQVDERLLVIHDADFVLAACGGGEVVEQALAAGLNNGRVYRRRE